MSTYRERREAKAERLRGWADGRQAKATAAHNAGNAISQHIPMGQPILVGHHSEKRHRRDIARMHSHADKVVEHSNKADSMRSRADNIERAAANAIYSDDHDAIERLDEKIAKLEAERDGIKAYNKKARAEKRETVGSYKLTNLGATIRTAKQRRDHLARERALTEEQLQDRTGHWNGLHLAAHAAHGADDNMTRYYAGKLRTCRQLAETLGYTIDHLIGEAA